MKRAIRMHWTCCDECGTTHRNLAFARLHFEWLRVKALLARYGWRS